MWFIYPLRLKVETQIILKYRQVCEQPSNVDTLRWSVRKPSYLSCPSGTRGQQGSLHLSAGGNTNRHGIKKLRLCCILKADTSTTKSTDGLLPAQVQDHTWKRLLHRACEVIKMLICYWLNRSCNKFRQHVSRCADSPTGSTWSRWSTKSLFPR